MSSASPPEHFVTHFDSYYLPLGLCLYRSLAAAGKPFTLWIVALDEACAALLERLALPRARILRLGEIETPALRSVRPQRSRVEYYWTLTPFLPAAVLARAPEAARVTYLDADLYFFADPAPLLDELAASGGHVLVTEHGFAPEYADKLRYGRFCVQFLTFRNTQAAVRVLNWWQERCLEWCYDREEDGKFGDQKYLDLWPGLFPGEVHVLAQAHRTLAPWNVAHLEQGLGRLSPVFYHFHHLKIVSPRRVVLYHSYRVGERNRWIYERYLAELREVARQLRGLDFGIVGRPALAGARGALRLAWHRLRGRAELASL